MISKNFQKLMQKIEWLPKVAAFQMSKNKSWGRHIDWPRVKAEGREKETIEAIAKAWGLVPFAVDDYYAYFGQEYEKFKFSL